MIPAGFSFKTISLGGGGGGGCLMKLEKELEGFGFTNP